MFDIRIQFENETDKESFVSSITKSFNERGRYKSVHANRLERSGDTLFFTRQPEPEVGTSYVDESPSMDLPSLEEGLVAAGFVPVSTVHDDEGVAVVQVFSGGGDAAGAGAGGDFSDSGSSNSGIGE